VVTDDVVEYILPLTKLTVLGLNGTSITNAGLVRLKELPNLVELSLAYSEDRITNDRLAPLESFTRLKRLELHWTDVGDAGLLHLYGLKNLQQIDLRRTKVTAAGIAALQKALPDCKIDWDAPAAKSNEVQ
jgi:hypothetical protein